MRAVLTGCVLLLGLLLITGCQTPGTGYGGGKPGGIAIRVATYTPNLNLAKPGYGDMNWHLPINSNLDILDTSLGIEHDTTGAHLAIGTITPAAGTFTAVAATGAMPILTLTDSTVGDDDWRIYAEGDEWFLQQNLADAAWTTRFRITGTGAASVGAAAPGGKFHAFGPIYSGDSAGGTAGKYRLYDDDGTGPEYIDIDPPAGASLTANRTVTLPDASGEVLLTSSTKSRSITIKSPVVADDFFFWQTTRAIVLTGVSARCIDGTNVVGQLQEYDGNAANPADCEAADWTITAAAEYTDASFTDPNIDAGDWIGWKTTSVTGAVSFMSLTFEYYEL